MPRDVCAPGSVVCRASGKADTLARQTTQTRRRTADAAVGSSASLQRTGRPARYLPLWGPAAACAVQAVDPVPCPERVSAFPSSGQGTGSTACDLICVPKRDLRPRRRESPRRDRLNRVPVIRMIDADTDRRAALRRRHHGRRQLEAHEMHGGGLVVVLALESSSAIANTRSCLRPAPSSGPPLP